MPNAAFSSDAGVDDNDAVNLDDEDAADLDDEDDEDDVERRLEAVEHKRRRVDRCSSPLFASHLSFSSPSECRSSPIWSSSPADSLLVSTQTSKKGSCGSCWSFSTTGALEGAHFLATGELVSLSKQQLVDCDHEAGGLEREENYLYTETNRGGCKFDKTKVVASVSNFSVVSIDEDQIAANLLKNGPLAVGINAVYMQTYIGGVSCPYICGKHLDHGVLLVGYGSAAYCHGPQAYKPRSPTKAITLPNSWKILETSPQFQHWSSFWKSLATQPSLHHFCTKLDRCRII
ncbi:hypothetical protein Ddye_001896 [Dipteronia dyeriana]|uniref:Peptidase C1A papain C-terminal domain-containing protein n=1 Tax=Dipteronia dyeriana TaxID=168575 RepID=A0AAD9XPX9_9ROSI|nr:hypothetical protein Ddye_001896 [Dipteronia dyeriana]